MEAMRIASEICIFTNANFTVEALGWKLVTSGQAEKTRMTAKRLAVAPASQAWGKTW